jgi:hypothetical protein
VKQSARAVVHAQVTVVKEEKSMCVCTCMSLAITIFKQLLTVTTDNPKSLIFHLYIQVSLSSKYIRALSS